MNRKINTLARITTFSLLAFNMLIGQAWSQELALDYSLLENDKEEKSYVLSSRKREKINRNTDQQLQDILKEVLYTSVAKIKVDKEDNLACDLGLIDEFFTGIEYAGLELTERKVEDYLDILRSNNSIDDIFYKLLLDLSKLKFGLIEYSEKSLYPRNWDTKPHRDIFQENNVKNLYSEFSRWPDEINNCSLGAWVRLKNKIIPTRKKLRNKDIRRLNGMAYVQGVVDLETYRRLEYLRKNDIVEDRIIFLGGYLNKILLSKNTLVPYTPRVYEIPVEEEERFASKRKNIFKSTTMREKLYQRYNDEQIVILAQILRKASMRMGADPDVESSIPTIIQEFTYQDQRGEYVTKTEEYKLVNASDQYDYARKRMRMDIYETNMFKSFSHVQIKFEDVVMAALETGYITHEEVELVLQYDDLWNKETSKLMKAVRFVMGIGGTAVFYLPPPYNILGGIAVALINAKVINKKDGDDNDNPASLFD